MATKPLLSTAVARPESHAVKEALRPVDRRAMLAAQDAAARKYWKYPPQEWQEQFQEEWVRTHS